MIVILQCLTLIGGYGCCLCELITLMIQDWWSCDDDYRDSSDVGAMAVSKSYDVMVNW